MHHAREVIEKLNEKKRLVELKKAIIIPIQGRQNMFSIQGEENQYKFYIVRKGKRAKRFTLFLNLDRAGEWKTKLIRLDLYGGAHRNVGILKDHPYYNQRIASPHVHIADSLEDEEVNMIAYPINDEYVKLKLSIEEQRDYKKVVKKFLEYCSITNLEDYPIEMEEKKDDC